MAFAYATRLELAGVVLVAVSGFAAAWFVRQGAQTVSRRHALLEVAQSGTWGHPLTVERFTQAKSAEGRLLYAVARQEEGAHRNAEEVYRDLTNHYDPPVAAIAQNNLGVILHLRGRADGAEKAFGAATKLDPSLAEARYNLGQAVDSARTSRARKYRPGEKLLALPGAEIMSAAFADSPALAAGEAGPVREFGVAPWLLTLNTAALVVFALIFLLVLPFFGLRQEAAAGRRSPLAGLAYVVPGTSARLAPVGGLILAAWLFCLLTLVQVVRQEFATSLDPVRQEELVRAFGFAGGVGFAFEQAIAVAGPVAFVGLWVLNMLLVARRRREAPPGAPPPAPLEKPEETEKPEDAGKEEERPAEAGAAPAEEPVAPAGEAPGGPGPSPEEDSKRRAEIREFIDSLGKGGGAPEVPPAVQHHAARPAAAEPPSKDEAAEESKAEERAFARDSASARRRAEGAGPEGPPAEEPEGAPDEGARGAADAPGSGTPPDDEGRDGPSRPGPADK
jgi:hypothetical protein